MTLYLVGVGSPEELVAKEGSLSPAGVGLSVEEGEMMGSPSPAGERSPSSGGKGLCRAGLNS